MRETSKLVNLLTDIPALINSVKYLCKCKGEEEHWFGDVFKCHKAKKLLLCEDKGLQLIVHSYCPIANINAIMLKGVVRILFCTSIRNQL